MKHNCQEKVNSFNYQLILNTPTNYISYLELQSFRLDEKHIRLDALVN